MAKTDTKNKEGRSIKKGGRVKTLLLDMRLKEGGIRHEKEGAMTGLTWKKRIRTACGEEQNAKEATMPMGRKPKRMMGIEK